MSCMLYRFVQVVPSTCSRTNTHGRTGEHKHFTVAQLIIFIVRHNHISIQWFYNSQYKLLFHDIHCRLKNVFLVPSSCIFYNRTKTKPNEARPRLRLICFWGLKPTSWIMPLSKHGPHCVLWTTNTTIAYD